MFCPRCKAEYSDGVTKCVDCDVALVERLAEKKEPKATGFVEILSTFNASDVAMVESILSEIDVPHYFQGENFLFVRPLVEPARLMVAEDRAEEVRILLKDLKLLYRGIDISGNDERE